jgi:hypothetical protein
MDFCPERFHLNQLGQETLLSRLDRLGWLDWLGWLGWLGWGNGNRLGRLGWQDLNEVGASYTSTVVVDHNGFVLDIAILSWEEDVSVVVAGLGFAVLGGCQVTMFAGKVSLFTVLGNQLVALVGAVFLDSLGGSLRGVVVSTSAHACRITLGDFGSVDMIRESNIRKCSKLLGESLFDIDFDASTGLLLFDHEICLDAVHVDSSLVLILGLSDASADQGDDCEKSDLHVEILSVSVSVRQEMNGLECVYSVCEGSRGGVIRECGRREEELATVREGGVCACG